MTIRDRVRELRRVQASELVPHPKNGANILNSSERAWQARSSDGQVYYDVFKHLHSALFWRAEDLMFIHTAYFDDSGKKDTDMLVVAGYLSTIERWERFNADWRLLLAKKHIHEFKRADFEYKRIGKWPANERIHFLRELADIIHEHTIYAFGQAVKMADWRKANEKYQLAERNFYPYPLCARTCMRDAREWCQDHMDTTKLKSNIFSTKAANMLAISLNC